jgi:MoaA/NifB/PqqE/SkfB family radical SAM enzyme
MYLEITNKCNMNCAHCCGSYGPKKDSHMSKETLHKALALAAEYGQSIFIGGGEPTVHPMFWEFLGIILSQDQNLELENMGMVTNGKKTKDALALASLARRGVLSVSLSQDQFHEAIDYNVIKAFSVTGERRDGDLRSIRTVRNVIAQGRGKNIAGAIKDDCCCEELIVDSKGNLWPCGCKNKCFGTVDQPDIPKEFWEDTFRCWSKREEDKKTEEKFAEVFAHA